MREPSVLGRYLREKGGRAAVFLLAAGVFVGMPLLYGQSPEPALYAALLVCFFGALGLGRGYLGYRERLRQLEQLARRTREEPKLPLLSQELPQAQGEEQRLLLELCGLLEDHRQQGEEEARRRAAQAMEYYTLWAHQIKTPLSAIRLLLQDDTRPLSREEVGRELFKVEQYVQMVLQFQRLETPGTDLVLRRCPLEELVRQAVRRVRPLFLHKHLSLRMGPLQGEPVTDEKWMVFVLEQLLTNAVKYTPQGVISITQPPGEGCRLVIEDTGIGILPEDLPRVFDWGFTGFNGRMDKRSTGIGLYLCRQTVELLGHGISIQSQPGRGTRVILRLEREELLIE